MRCGEDYVCVCKDGYVNDTGKCVMGLCLIDIIYNHFSAKGPTVLGDPQARMFGNTAEMTGA